jgi:hypothetical protein
MTLAAAWANEDDTDGEVPEVSTRLEMIEEINVTADKPPPAAAADADDEIDAILEEADALEADHE